jgi:hypothetical protein
MKKMRAAIRVSSSAACAIDTTFALAAVERILHEFASGSEQNSLALNIRQLHLPFEATIRVPITALVSVGEARNQWRLHIRAAVTPALYPTFDGVLSLLPAPGQGCQLRLDGGYTPPLGVVGRAIDATVLAGAARSSLERFLREVAHRVAALAQWAHG